MTSNGRPCTAWTGTGSCGAPARLYPAGWRCPDHTPARIAGMPEPPSVPYAPVRLGPGPAAPCRYCGGTTYGRDDDGPAHECCRAWRAVIEAGRPCPACEAGRWLANPRTRRQPMPPLPGPAPGRAALRPRRPGRDPRDPGRAEASQERSERPHVASRA
jgi:hypothetical protein